MLTENSVTGLVYLNGFIYSVSRDYSLIKWKVDGSKVKQVNNIHTDWIINIEVMRTKNLIITNSRDGSVKVSCFTLIAIDNKNNFQVWDPSTIECIAFISPESETTCSISANSTTIFTGAQSKHIKIWKLNLPKSQKTEPT